MSTVPRNRNRLARRLGWFAAATLVVAAFAPSVSAEPIITHPTGNPSCTSLGYEFEFKIDSGDLEERTYEWDEGLPVTGNWTGQSITITEVSADGQTFSWTSELAVTAVLVKAGVDNHSLYSYDPAVFGDTDLTHAAGQQGLSHVSFCGNPAPPPSSAPPSSAPPSSAPPSAPPSSAPPSAPPSSAPPSAPPSSAPPSTPPPTGSVLPTQSTAPSPTGEVGGATGTPATTLPPTDTLGDAGAAPGSDAWRLVLLALGGTLAAALLLTPARAVRKDR